MSYNTRDIIDFLGDVFIITLLVILSLVFCMEACV